MLISINAGHCVGLDSGAVGTYSTEAEINVKVAKLVCSYLEAVGYATLYIHEDELYDIVDISNNTKADLFVSIHCNSASNASAKGIETFYHSGSVNGEKLAHCIQNQLLSTFPSRLDRGLKTNSLYVVRNTDCPACLVELGFISNSEEEDFINNNIDEFARAVARGITDYFV